MYRENRSDFDVFGSDKIILYLLITISIFFVDRLFVPSRVFCSLRLFILVGLTFKKFVTTNLVGVCYVSRAENYLELR